MENVTGARTRLSAKTKRLCSKTADESIRALYPIPMSAISDLRQSYSNVPPLLERHLPGDPMDFFHRWLKEAIAAEILEPNAMTLATVDALGMPEARIVLLKDADARGFTFFTNYGSAKGISLAARPQASLVFYWDILFRQVRVRGTVEKVSREETAAYWRTRPRGSRLGARASVQSTALASRAQLEEAFAREEARFGGQEGTDDIPLPDAWGGYRIVPEFFEFWQGQTSRLHDRLTYARTKQGWQIGRLAP